MTEALPYEVISAETNPLLQTFGAACVPLESYVYHFMSKMAGESYGGGQWEFRKYANGALCMVFPDQTEIEPHLLNQNYVKCSLEALSYGVWLIVLSSLSHEIARRDDQKTAELIHDQYHGLLDAISGRIRFIITPGEGEGYRDPTPDEEDSFFQEGKLRSHPESQAIYQIID